jgi:hypothetical protein
MSCSLPIPVTIVSPLLSEAGWSPDPGSISESSQTKRLECCRLTLHNPPLSCLLASKWPAPATKATG